MLIEKFYVIRTGYVKEKTGEVIWNGELPEDDLRCEFKWNVNEPYDFPLFTTFEEADAYCTSETHGKIFENVNWYTKILEYTSDNGRFYQRTHHWLYRYNNVIKKYSKMKSEYEWSYFSYPSTKKEMDDLKRLCFFDYKVTDLVSLCVESLGQDTQIDSLIEGSELEIKLNELLNVADDVLDVAEISKLESIDDGLDIITSWFSSGVYPNQFEKINQLRVIIKGKILALSEME